MGISISKGPENDLNLSHSLLSRLDASDFESVRHFIAQFLAKDIIPNFSAIEIETVNRCNNDCPFCPVNRNNDTRKPKKMSEDLFRLLIDQLKSIDYRGSICLFSNNEPLIDERILDFIDYAKMHLPHAHHHLYTNAILLDDAKFLRLIKSLDRLTIDNYDDNFNFTPPVQKILDSNINKDFKCDVTISLRKKHQKLNTRGGSAPNRIDDENKFAPPSPCSLPFTQMIIRPDGTAAKCCNDPLNEMTLGDLNNQSILEIWRGKAYQEFRKEMYYNGRRRIKGCTYCDYGLFFQGTSLPKAALSDEYQRFSRELKIRKSLGEIYLFDTSPLSIVTHEKMKLYGVEFDGMINVRNETGGGMENVVSLEKVLQEHGFILFPTPYYDDAMFEFFHANGYVYGRDYLIYPRVLV